MEYYQFTDLLLLALPVACVAWTVTHEEIFREPREMCVKKSRHSESIWERKFFYLFTCEYCFSHYVALIFVLLTNFQLLQGGVTGYLIGFFALVWIANVYMTLFGILRQSLKVEKLTGNLKEELLEEKKQD